METGPAIHVKPTTFTPQQMIIVSENELVAIKIGNTTLRVHYEDAFRISQMIRVRAKEAKRFVGDNSRHWSLIANLDGLG